MTPLPSPLRYAHMHKMQLVAEVFELRHDECQIDSKLLLGVSRLPIHIALERIEILHVPVKHGLKIKG
jgi:hypothetical protein